MNKHKFKVGDIVIGIDNDPHFPTVDIIGKIGTITSIDNVIWVKFKSSILNEFYKESCWVNEDEIKLYLTKAKLKKLLQE